MSPDTLRRAQALYDGLPEASRTLIKQGLAGRLRSTGLRATLAWLEASRRGERVDERVEASRAVSAALRRALGLSGRELGELENLELLDTLRHATALLDALHTIDRVARRGA